MEYKEIHKLHRMLCERGVEHNMHRAFDGYRIAYPSADAGVIVYSIIEHFASMGHERDLLEIRPYDRVGWQLDVDGYLSAAEVYRRIITDWESRAQEETEITKHGCDTCRLLCHEEHCDGCIHNDDGRKLKDKWEPLP